MRFLEANAICDDNRHAIILDTEDDNIAFDHYYCINDGCHATFEVYHTTGEVTEHYGIVELCPVAFSASITETEGNNGAMASSS